MLHNILLVLAGVLLTLAAETVIHNLCRAIRHYNRKRRLWEHHVANGHAIISEAMKEVDTAV